MREFIIALSRHAPLKSGFLLLIMLCTSALEGAGLLMLIPLLSLAGLTPLGASSHFLASLSQHLHQANWMPSLNEVLVIYVLLVSAMATLNYAKNMLAAKLRVQFCEALRNKTHRELLQADWLFLMQQKQSDLAHALTTETARISTAIHQLIQFISNALLVCIYLVISLSVSWPLTLLSFVAGGGILWICRGLNRRALNSGSQLFSDSQTLYSRTFNHLNSLKIAKSSCLESRYQDEFEGINNAIRQDQEHFSRASALTTASYQVLAVVVFAISFGFAFEVWHLALANLLVMLVLFARLFPRLNQLQSLWQNVLNLLPAFTEIEKLRHKAQAASEAKSSFGMKTLTNNIQIKALSYHYADRQKPVLKQLDLTIERGERIALIGKSGCGKTTLVDCIAGLMLGKSGQILIDGVELNKNNLSEWRKQVAYFTQDCFLFAGSVAENLRLVKADASNGELWRALKQANAAEFVSELGGLDSQVGDLGRALSGGQRQRICIARTLLQKPQLLILDEATSQIDELSETQIIEALTSLGAKMTVLLITHRTNLLNCVDRVIQLKNGAVVVAKSEGLSKLRKTQKPEKHHEPILLPRV